MGRNVFVLGSFVADVAFRSGRLPAWGETLMGSAFALGPGGKGSNQAIAAARAGASVQILSKLGDDAFGQLARSTWAAERIDASLVGISERPTGAAAILIDEACGENAIIVVPGACYTLTAAEVNAASDAIRSSAVLMTQLELRLEAVRRGLEIAREASLITILNPAPAPAAPLPRGMLALADYLIPNESEAALLSGLPVETPEQAEAAAALLQARGARNIIVTLGARGALICPKGEEVTLVPAFDAGPALDTAGAGDAFCGGFAAALAEGIPMLAAVRFGNAAAALSVTRPGTATSMPKRAEIEALLAPADQIEL